MPPSPLQPHQRAFVARVLPQYRVVRDVSWGITDTVVLLVSQGAVLRVVKAFGPNNHHFEREHEALTAHAHVLASRAGQLIAASTEARVLITAFLPGVLVQGSLAEHDPAVHEQAGWLLQDFHAQDARPSAEYELAEVSAALRWLRAKHRIPPHTAAAVTAYLEAYEPSDGIAVPTHGDYQPRNWLIDDDGVVRMIDFGRFAWRPPESDFSFLHVRQWHICTECEIAFFRGYGADPRAAHPERWQMYQVRFAVGAAAWGYQFGQTTMEREGLEILARLFHTALRS